MSASCMSGTALISLCAMASLFANSVQYCYHPYLADEKTEAQEDTAGEQRGHDVNLVRPVLKPLYLISAQFCLYLENNQGTREAPVPNFLGYVLGWALYVKKDLVLGFQQSL